MQFCFYPTLEHSCGNVCHCPHLGGAAIEALMQIANGSGQTVEHLHRQLNAERELNHRLEEGPASQHTLASPVPIKLDDLQVAMTAADIVLASWGSLRSSA